MAKISLKTKYDAMSKLGNKKKTSCVYLNIITYNAPKGKRFNPKERKMLDRVSSTVAYRL